MNNLAAELIGSQFERFLSIQTSDYYAHLSRYACYLGLSKILLGKALSGNRFVFCQTL